MLQLVDSILSAVCKTVVLQEDKPDASYRYVFMYVMVSGGQLLLLSRWLSDLLTVLGAHTHFHEPLYLRLTELLTTQVGNLVLLDQYLLYY